MKLLEAVGGLVSDVDTDIWSFLSPKALVPARGQNPEFLLTA
jgi:hypothetical protein